MSVTRTKPPRESAPAPSECNELDFMSQPLHPLHQRLAEHFVSLPEPVTKKFRVATRFAIVTYAGVGSWGLVWLIARGLARLV